MELRQLRYFCVAAQCENLTVASERLHVAQSAVSRQIAKLEQELGVALFVRHGKRIRLSLEGARLRQEADSVLEAVGALAAAARDVSPNAGEGLVTMAGDSSVCGLLAPLLARRLQAEHPRIQFRIIESFARESRALLSSGSADLAVALTDMSDSATVSDPLCSDSPCLFYLPQLDSGLGEQCTFSEALQRPLILPPSPSEERSAMEAAAHAAGFSLNVVAEADRYSMIKALALEGLGNLMLVTSSRTHDAELKAFRSSVISDVTLTYFLSQPRERLSRRPTKIVAEMIREEVAKLAAAGHLSPVAAMSRADEAREPSRNA